MLGLMLHFQDRVQCSVLCLYLNLSPFPFKLTIPGEYMKLRVLCQSFINTFQLVAAVIAMRVVVSFPTLSPLRSYKKNCSILQAIMPTLLTVQVGLDRIVRESDTSDCERPVTSVIRDTIVIGSHENSRSSTL